METENDFRNLNVMTSSLRLLATRRPNSKSNLFSLHKWSMWYAHTHTVVRCLHDCRCMCCLHLYHMTKSPSGQCTTGEKRHNSRLVDEIIIIRADVVFNCGCAPTEIYNRMQCVGVVFVCFCHYDNQTKY